MATTRQSIVRGPGSITFNSQKFFDASGITAEIDSASADISSSVAGKLDTIKTDQIGRISLTPIGSITSALLGILYPSYAQKPVLGTSLFGSTDIPLVISSMAGQKVTFKAAALTKCPDLLLSPVKTAFGGVEFTALVANGKLPSDSKALYEVAAATYADGTPSRTGLTGVHYTATYGSLSIPDTLDGWTVSVDMATSPVQTDSQGTIDYTLSGVTVTAKCTPLGLTESQILSALPAAKGRGVSLASTSDLVITGAGGLTVTLKNAALVTGPLNWGADTLRAGEIGFTANIATTGELFSVALTTAS